MIVLVLAAACSGGSGAGSGGVEPPAGLPREDALYYDFLGQKRVLFVIVELLDAPALFASSPAGEAEVQALRSDLIAACSENSQGLLSLQVDYTWPPLAIPKSTGEYDPVTGLVEVRADALEAAQQAGYAPNSYDREVIWSPLVWTSKAHGIGRTVWMPHKLTWILFHEFGHALAWGHANLWDGDPLGAGASVEYGDLFDPMGAAVAFHHSGPWFKNRVGWLPEQRILSVTQPGTYAIAELEHPLPALPSALRIRRDANLDYWIFHRGEEPLVANGAVIVRTGNNPAGSSLLLDMNPGSSGPEAEDAALGPGQVFDDAAHAIRVANVSAGTGPVTLDVTVDPARQAALDRVPTVRVLLPAFDRGPLSGVVSFEVEIRDPDAGSANGAGIAAVELSILQPIQDPFILLASTTLSTPPYTWLLDTSALRDEKHFFGVTATAVDGGVRSVLVPILVDNGTGNAPPAIHGLTHAVPVPLVDRSGRALVGARIAASCRGRELLAISDGEGRASLAFDAATPGAAIRFGGTAGAAGFAAQRFEALAAEGRELLIWNEGQAQAGHAVVLDPAVAVHGIVVDARGLPAAGVRIEVSLGAGARAYGCEPGPFCSTVWTAETDVAGGYAIEGLPAGRPTRWVLELPDGRRRAEAQWILGFGVVRRDWSL